jgi:hypothetical protein
MPLVPTPGHHGYRHDMTTQVGSVRCHIGGDIDWNDHGSTRITRHIITSYTSTSYEFPGLTVKRPETIAVFTNRLMDGPLPYIPHCAAYTYEFT